MADSYKECRYGDEVEVLFGDWEVLKDLSVADYQGTVEVLFRKKGDYPFKNEYAYVEFSYGSCSGCDEWEDRGLNSEQVQEEIKKLTLTLSHSDMWEWMRKAKLMEGVEL